MSQVVLLRIDDRLIHGQIVTNWVSHVRAKSIMVVDDKTASNQILCKVLKMVAPPGIPVSILDLKTAVDTLSQCDKHNRIMIITKTPETAKQLILNVSNDDVFPQDINVGNSCKTPERNKITPNVYLDTEGLAALKEIKSKGFEIFFQTIPGDTRYSWEKVIKQ